MGGRIVSYRQAARCGVGVHGRNAATAESYVLNFTAGPGYFSAVPVYGVTQNSVVEGRATFEADAAGFVFVDRVTDFELKTPEVTFTESDLAEPFGAFILLDNGNLFSFQFTLSDGRGDVFSNNSASFTDA